MSVRESVLEKIFYGTGFGRERMSAARAGYLLLIWVVVPTWLVTAYFNLLVGLAFTGTFYTFGERFGADISFRHPHLAWTGDISIDDLIVRPRDPSSGGRTVQVRRVLIDMPNWGVMQSIATATRDGGDENEAGMLKVIDRMDHIGLQLEGVQVDLLRGLPGVLSNIGMASAAPLETEGCKADNMWVASELSKLGIESRGIDLQLTLANAPEAREVRVTGRLVSPHSSSVDFAQHFRATSLSAFLDAPEGSRIATYERIAVQDDGFVAARDAYCAKRDGIAPEEFRERHLASMRRLLQAGGLRPTPEVETVYRRYLEHGKLVVEARPSGTIRRADYHNYAVADQVRLYNGTIAADAKSIPLAFEEVPSRGIPVTFRGSTWDLVDVESRAPGQAPAVTPLPPEPKPAPVVAAAAPAPTTTSTSTPTAPAVASAAASAAPKPLPAGLPAWAIPPTTTRTTADGRPLASSLPKAANSRSGAKTLEFSELSAHIGDRVEITTVYGERHTGQVIGVSGQTLQLRMAIAVGYAITNFERSNIRLIRDLE